MEKISATESHAEFVRNYSISSISDKTIQRFLSVKSNLIRFGMGKNLFLEKSRLNVCDIGCNAGTQCAMWEDDGHRAYGLDINEPLLFVAKERLHKRFGETRLSLGSAKEMPYQGGFFDICLVPELLEHVNEWKVCLDEFARILKPGGILFITTSNYLCPVQNEFNLPLYSWYPKRIKRIFEKKAITSNPELANYATFPAVNWFSYYSLKKELSKRGFHVYGRFDLTDLAKKNFLKKAAIKLFRTDSLMKLIAHSLTPSTLVVGIKKVDEQQ